MCHIVELETFVRKSYSNLLKIVIIIKLPRTTLLHYLRDVKRKRESRKKKYSGGAHVYLQICKKSNYLCLTLEEGNLLNNLSVTL